MQIITLTGYNVLPQPDEPITTSLVEALHFRTGFHYIMVREMEMQIPIPSLPGMRKVLNLMMYLFKYMLHEHYAIDNII